MEAKELDGIMAITTELKIVGIPQMGGILDSLDQPMGSHHSSLASRLSRLDPLVSCQGM
jgi:hypothetical protein